MYTSIVVPLDGSVFGNGALPVASALARRSDAALHLVLVRDPVAIAAAGPYGARLLDAAEPERRAAMERVAAHIAQGTLRVTAEFLDGPVVPTLERYLENPAHDLVVMMSHGRGGLSRAWLGNVADGLIRHAGVPLLLLREDTPWLRAAAEPLFRRIMIPLDGSALAESVLDNVVALGTTDVTEYVILAVVAPHHDGEANEHDARIFPGHSVEEQHHDAALAYLHAVAADLRSTGAGVTVRAEVHQHTARGILDAAEEHHADLIALSTHGRGAMPRFVHGSVADKVIRGATVPVLVHRPSQRELLPSSTTGGESAARR